MQTTRRAILDSFLAYVNAAGDAKARDIAEPLLNRVLEKIWMQRGWNYFIDPDVWEIATVANARAYALPDHFGRVSSKNRVIRNLTRGSQIFPKDRGDLEEEDPTTGTSLETPGPPVNYAIVGATPVQQQPASTGEALEVVSDSASDTTVRVFIEGLTTGNLVAQRQVTLTGVGAVAIGTWKRVLKFGKAYPDGTDPTTEMTSSEGSVTLRVVAGATLQILAPWQDAREHQTIVLSPIPDAVYTIGIPIFRAIERTYLDADPLPPMWENAVFDGLTHFWRIGDRDVAEDAVGMWPSLKELIEYDNAELAQARRFRRPFTGA
jgi:hypothetical protein